jgi:branched-chain amino acid transport system ATP-binding protein
MMPILDIKGLQKDFGGLRVIFGIDLSIEQGERHAVIGPNGAGKSTLFNLITGKYIPTRGKILFKNHDITGLPPHKISHLGVARSFQITNIFRTMTVFENIRNAMLSKKNFHYNLFSPLSKMNDIREETEKVMSLVGLAEKKDNIAGELSYGHQRALEIALTIAMDPDLILLDEPTAGMSKGETMEMVELIEKVTEKKTLIIVEHDMDVVFRLANRITVIYYGKVLASGPPERIRNDPQVKDAYLGQGKE